MRLVFVSSTFRDMQFERDALNTRVVPRINQFLERYSETIHFGDLRWGVNTTELEGEESSKKVLKVCLDQVDDCKPYMIIFIGERYGWIPSRDLLHGAALLKGMDISAIKEDTSVTGLEIEYGALLNPDYEGRILFYFRNPFDMSEMTEAQKADYLSESPLHKEKIEQLKAQIKEKYPDYIRYYDVSYDADSQKLVGLDALMDQIYQDLQRIFDLDLTYLNSLPVEERALSNSQNHFEKLAANSYCRELSAVNEFDVDAAEYCHEYRFESCPVLEVVTGPHGIGAKTLVAQKHFNTLDAGYNSVCFSYGMDEFTDSVGKMLSALCYRMEEFMELPHGTEATTERFAYLCEEYTKNQELPYLYFHFINLPANTMAVFHKVAAIYPFLFGVGFCLHFRTPLSTQTALPFFLKNHVLQVPELNADEIGEMVNAILKSKRKELPPIVIDEIQKHSAANLPLYLSLLVERLLILDSEDFAAIRARGDGMDNINAYMIDLIRKSGDNVTEIAKELLEELADRINPVMVPHLVAHIAQSTHFNETGIQEFFDHEGWKYSALDYTLFKKTFPSLVYQGVNGYLWYTNDDVKAAAQQLTAQWGTGKDVSAMIRFLDTKQIKHALKAKLMMYRYVGDTAAFVDCVETYLDGTVYQPEKKALGELCHSVFYDIMYDEISKNSEFALPVAKAIFDDIANGKIKYPYEMTAYFLQCIPSSTVYEKEDVIRTYDFLKQLEPCIAKLRKKCKDEALTFAHHLLCGSYMLPLLVRIGGEKGKTDGERIKKCMKSFGPQWGQKTLQIIWEKKLPLYDLLKDSSIELFRMFSGVMQLENPTKELEFFKMKHQCANLEAYMTQKEPERYDALLKGEIEKLPQDTFGMYALLLSMLGFCSFHMDDAEKAKVYYDAFYTLFIKHFKENPPSPKNRSMYISAIKNYCKFLIDQENADVVDERYRELFSWCLVRMAEPPIAFESAYELLQMHRLGCEYDCFEDDTVAFSPILGQILSEADSVVASAQTLFNTAGYIAYFSDVLTADETQYYFIELMSRLVSGALIDAKVKLTDVLKVICECVVEVCLETKGGVGDLLKPVITRITQEHSSIFKKPKEYYLNTALEITQTILEERLQEIDEE